MFRRILICACALLFVGRAGAQDAAEDAVRATVKAYVEAFNAHRADGLAALWEEDAVYVDRNTGVRLEGRAAIQEDFQELFTQHSDARLTGEVDSVDFVTDDVANIEGRATVFLPDVDPNETSFTATLVRHGDKWLLHAVHESNLPAPVTSFDALQELAWMLGDWVDRSETLTVETSVNWSPNGAFLLRSFVVSDAEGPVREGTQIIGWDPRSKEIRSWTFNSDGTFGDGVWTKSEDHWLVRSTQTLADGAAATGTYVITPVDADSMTVKLIGHEVDGAPQPASEEVTIVRAAAEATGGAE